MNNLFKINGNPEQYEDLDVFHKLAQQFLPYAQQSLGFDKPVGVNLLSDPENVKDPLGKTAYYDPNKMEITLFVDKRHVKDLLRSMAHELVHHTQNCRGEFDGGVHTGPGYAQDDEHMRKMEAEAYLKGSGFLLRDWEDSLKENKRMSKLNENREGSLKRLIQGAVKDAVAMGKRGDEIGQVVVNLMLKAGVNLNPRRNILDPGKDPDTKEIQKIVNRKETEEMDAAMRAKMPSMLDDDELGQSAEAMFEEGDKTSDSWSAPLEEGEGALCPKCKKRHPVKEMCGDPAKHENLQEEEAPKEKKEETPEEKKARLTKSVKKKTFLGAVEENWTKKNKDQLLFERLIEKWIK